MALGYTKFILMSDVLMKVCVGVLMNENQDVDESKMM
jgi:hypothetical protein